MAKMFYTLEEVAQKLGKSEDEVKEMAKRGEIQEFRDREKLMFKVEQIDLLAGGDDDDDDMPLGLEDSASSASASGLGLDVDDTGADQQAPADEGQPEKQSEGQLAEKPNVREPDQSGGGSGLDLTDTSGDTGVSVFDSGHGEHEPQSEQTHAGEAIDEELSLESVGSGSGLLDLTRESDDTTLGAEFIEDALNSEDDEIELPANASGLFESAGAESPGESLEQQPMGSMPMMVESYDGAWSGFGVGAMIGTAAALVITALIAMVAVGGATPQLATDFAESETMFWGVPGALLGVVLVCGLIGFFIGRATE